MPFHQYVPSTNNCHSTRIFIGWIIYTEIDVAFSRSHCISWGWLAFRGDISGSELESELGAAESACRPQSRRQQAMLLGHSASAPFLGAGLHWWHGLPSVYFAGAAPLGVGSVTSNASRWHVSRRIGVE